MYYFAYFVILPYLKQMCYNFSVIFALWSEVGIHMMIPEILVIDDDAMTLETMRSYLEDIARVHTVNGGRQALEYLHQHRVDIILLDVEMPLMDGYATLEQLRKLEECINVPVILCTGRQDRNTIFNFTVMGVDGYMLKPVNKDLLVCKVKEICEVKEHSANKSTVLMIDDDMTYLKQLNYMLQDRYNVVMINSAKLALNYLSKHKPDIILLDYQMPLYNGANLMNMIQKSNKIPIPVILLSGALNRKALEECYPYNPAAYLVKPVTKDVLIDNIETVLHEGDS